MSGPVSHQETSLQLGANNHNWLTGRAGKMAAVASMALLATGCSGMKNPFAQEPSPTYTPSPTLAPSVATTRANAAPSPNQDILIGIDTFGEGSEGANVEVLQSTLNSLGCSALSEDGVFGPTTEGVLRQFQERSGIYVDGVAGNQVIATLNEMIDSGNTNCGAAPSADTVPPIYIAPANQAPTTLVLAMSPSPEIIDGDLPYGCPGGPPGPLAPGTVCPSPDAQSPSPEAPDGDLPYGCPGGPPGPLAPGTICP